MSDFDLRPHVNKPTIAPDYRNGSWNFGLWLLVGAIAIAGLFALMFFADGSSTIEDAIDQPVLPASPETAPAPATPQPAPFGE